MNNKLLNQYLENEETYKPHHLSKIFTKVLISIIIVLLALIYTNYSDNNKSLFKEKFLENNISFYKFKNWLKPKSNEKKEDKLVMNNQLLLDEQTYLDGLSFKVNGPVELLQSGIVVFVGNKEGYNNTVIVQGSDGYDIWYGNLDDVNIQIYDYLDKQTILGNADTLYLKIIKDGNSISYQDYINV